MPSTTLKRRRTEDGMRGKTPKRPKKVKRQHEYYSSSEDEGGALDAPRETAQPHPKVKKNLATGANAVVALPDQGKEPSISAAEEPDLNDGKEPNLKEQDESEDSSLDDQDEFEIDAEDSEAEDADAGDDSEDSEGSEVSETSTNNPRKVRKRNDPEAFATSMSKILGTKLTSQKRSEPILSRSKAAQETNKSLADHKLTLKANRAVIAEKKAAQEKGRVKDVLGLQKADVSTAEIVAEEKRLRRTAQKGVIKLFNAVRAAQVKGEQAEKEARQKGVVGVAKREEKVKEMSKQGFLDMIAGGGKKKEGSVEA
ncbi:Rrp15p-domain-containing protein [Lophiostoma macrostomum CBS 122681]|uniref:Rrp15p-domain-containing protein n=1 Tax=Lophiostoma macrostomum CBS 122681 TaxID=1314788 RepID=A0A6A6SPI8_9PLEO|nr:Rrp15p-domain-containing protein [Lophiostoma macrostomum CBS 122681]